MFRLIFPLNSKQSSLVHSVGSLAPSKDRVDLQFLLRVVYNLVLSRNTKSVSELNTIRLVQLASYIS